MPMTSNVTSFTRTRCPIGSDDPKRSSAVCGPMTATRAKLPTSSALKNLPRSTSVSSTAGRRSFVPCTTSTRDSPRYVTGMVPRTYGVVAMTFGSAAKARASAAVSVFTTMPNAIAGGPFSSLPPGRMPMRFVPNDETWSTMSFCADRPIAETASVDITPMMMPSMVRIVRLFAAASDRSE